MSACIQPRPSTSMAMAARTCFLKLKYPSTNALRVSRNRSATTHSVRSRSVCSPRADVQMDSKDFTLKKPSPGQTEDGGSKLKEGLLQYEGIKEELVQTTMTQGGLVSLYLALVVNFDAGLSGFVGAAGAVAYVSLLSNYVDKLGKDGSWAPQTKQTRERELRKNPSPTAILQTIPNRIGDIYRQALLQQRLLVLPTLAASEWAFNQADLPVHFQLGYTFVGFLAYKTATLSWLWNHDLKPDIINGITGIEPENKRPVLAKIPDAEEILSKNKASS